jgi:hypothetical protein
MTTMKITSRKFGYSALLVAVAGSVAAFAPGVARADHVGPQTLQTVAALDRAARHLAEEIHFELGRTPQFAHLQQDAGELVKATQHLLTVAAGGGSLAHLQEDLREVQTAQQHLREVLAQTSSHPIVDRAMVRVEQLVVVLARQWNCAAAAPVIVVPAPVAPAPVAPSQPTIYQPYGSGGYFYRAPSYYRGVPRPQPITIQLGKVQLDFVTRGW